MLTNGPHRRWRLFNGEISLILRQVEALRLGSASAGQERLDRLKNQWYSRNFRHVFSPYYGSAPDEEFTFRVGSISLSITPIKLVFALSANSDLAEVTIDCFRLGTSCMEARFSSLSNCGNLQA